MKTRTQVYRYLAGLLVLLPVLALTRVAPQREKNEGDYESWEKKPVEKFDRGAENFQKIKGLLLSQYYGAVTEDELYRAATQGMLQNLDPAMAQWNKLLSPTELSETKADISGEIVGAGVEIKFDPQSGISDVLSTLPGTPAEAAGIQAGDKILSVNGKLYKGLQLRDVVYSIRGKAGESRKLNILRGDKVISKTLHLNRVGYANVTHSLLPSGIGLVLIRYFTGESSNQLKKAVQDLTGKGAHGLVIDLRGNEGGLFDRALESISLFVAKGSPLVRIGKKGKEEEIRESKEEPIVGKLPMVLLVNGATASGAEVFSAALKENLGATLVGSRTRGKWSLQSIEELPNQYGAKFTVGILKSAKGVTYGGKGVEPDIEVAMEADEVAYAQRISDPTAQIATDSQLRTALNLLKAR